jgi:RNA polymerase sigma-70 factor (ECF subfamily)
MTTMTLQDIIETFIIVWQQLPKFRNEANISTWIFRIASNNCLRQIEKQNRFLKAELPINLKEEKEENIEPQIQFLYKCISNCQKQTVIIISIRIRKHKQPK